MKKIFAAMLCLALCLGCVCCASAQTVSFGMKNYEDIRWLVLSSNSEHTRLMSEQCIDCRSFDDNSSDWASSDLRRWLNNSYAYQTFTPDELSAICPVEGDLIRLPSLADLTNPAYGFAASKDAEDGRRAAGGNADAVNHGLWRTAQGYCSYYTLTPRDATSLYQVRSSGSVGVARIDRDNVGVRIVIVVRTSALN